MKKIITTIIGVVLVVGIIFGIFWFSFNVGTRSETEVKETEQRETKQIETQQIENETQDDVVIVNREELQKKNEEQRKKEFEEEQLLEKTLLEICKRNGNWDNLILSNNFKEKYNEKNGIIDKNVNFDVALYVENINKKSKSASVILYKNLNKNNEIEYKCTINYVINEQNKIDDIVNIEIEKTNGEFSIKEEGDDKDWAYINENNISEIIYTVSKPKTYWDELKLTSNFKQKYTQDKGILKLDSNKVSEIYIIENDYKNKTIILEVLFDNRTTEKYKVKWQINNNKELDDVVVEKETVDISKIETYAKPVLKNKNKKEVVKEESVEE